jgi:hypothetical protein
VCRQVTAWQGCCGISPPQDRRELVFQTWLTRSPGPQHTFIAGSTGVRKSLPAVGANRDKEWMNTKPGFAAENPSTGEFRIANSTCGSPINRSADNQTQHYSRAVAGILIVGYTPHIHE